MKEKIVLYSVHISVSRVADVIIRVCRFKFWFFSFIIALFYKRDGILVDLLKKSY